jgi:hypothetical protein
VQAVLHLALQTWCAFNPDKPNQLLPTRCVYMYPNCLKEFKEQTTRCLDVYPDRLKQFKEQQTYCLHAVTSKHLSSKV